MKHIQLFTKGADGADTCEVSGVLISIVHKDGWTIVKSKEEDDTKTVWENRFPDWNVAVVRVYQND